MGGRNVSGRPTGANPFSFRKENGFDPKESAFPPNSPFLSTAVRSDDKQSPWFRCRFPVRFRWSCATSQGGWPSKNRKGSRPIGMLALPQAGEERQRSMGASNVPARTAVIEDSTPHWDLNFSLEIQKAFLFAKRKVVWPRCGTVRPRRPQAVKFPIPVQG